MAFFDRIPPWVIGVIAMGLFAMRPIQQLGPNIWRGYVQGEYVVVARSAFEETQVLSGDEARAMARRNVHDLLPYLAYGGVAGFAAAAAFRRIWGPSERAT